MSQRGEPASVEPWVPPPPRSRPPAARRRRRPPHARRRLAALLALLGGVVVVWGAFATFQPLKGDGEGRVSLRIPAGAGVGRIGEELERQGVVSSSFFFSLYATLTGQRGGLRSGAYALRRDMSNAAAIDALTAGPAARKPPTFSATIPEGRSRREIVPLLADLPLRGDYLRATRRSGRLNPRRLGAPAGTRSLEGFLFPATYELRRNAHVRELVDRQLAAFRDALGQVRLRRARRRNLTAYDVVIIASMVEREAQLDRERPLIAAVIHNRLRQGLPLGIDATIRYDLQNWTRPLRQSELQRDTPYNTRTRRGLPPTPIGNPGLASLKAAADPADVPFLFYVVKPGTCGEHSFSSTDAKFQRDVARYNAERAKQGGRSPTTCPS